jgi:hypothetical protein
MKEAFWEYYHPTKKELLGMKKKAVFTFDACALLKLYSYDNKKRKSFIKIIDELAKKDRIWIPHQFCKEFYKNRENRINQEYQKKVQLLEKLDKLNNDLVNNYFPEIDHFSIKIPAIINGLQNKIKIYKENIANNKGNPDWRNTSKDPLLKELERILKNKIGKEYGNDDQLNKEIELGKRIKLKMQPGRSDLNKGSSGDALAWLQILDYVKDSKKPMILVTEETKDDFWEEKKINDKIFPRRSLVKEFYTESKEIFTILSVEEFIKYITEKKYVPLFESESKENDQGEKVVGSSVVGVDPQEIIEEKVTNS